MGLHTVALRLGLQAVHDQWLAEQVPVVLVACSVGVGVGAYTLCCMVGCMLMLVAGFEA